jgi:hypothetical protein
MAVPVQHAAGPERENPVAGILKLGPPAWPELRTVLCMVELPGPPRGPCAARSAASRGPLGITGNLAVLPAGRVERIRGPGDGAGCLWDPWPWAKPPHGCVRRPVFGQPPILRLRGCRLRGFARNVRTAGGRRMGGIPGHLFRAGSGPRGAQGMRSRNLALSEGSGTG